MDLDVTCNIHVCVTLKPQNIKYHLKTIIISGKSWKIKTMLIPQDIITTYLHVFTYHLRAHGAPQL